LEDSLNSSMRTDEAILGKIDIYLPCVPQKMILGYLHIIFNNQVSIFCGTHDIYLSTLMKY